MKLENWSITHGLYKAPEQGGRLVGNVYGHPRHFDGKLVRTSRVVEVDPVAQTVRTHSGSIYELGTVDPGYEAVYPNARERVFYKEPERN